MLFPWPPLAVSVQIIEARETSLEDAFLVVGLPGRGLVGGIAANYLVKELRMEFLAGIQSDDLPPAATSVAGVAMSPIHLYVSDVICGMNKRCRRLVLLKSDIPIEHELYFSLASALIEWAKNAGIAEVAVLEGFERPAGEGEDEPVRALKNLHADVDFAKFGLTDCEEGVLTSFGAALLLKANAHKLPAVCLLAAVMGEGVDAKAAATLVKALNPLIPEVDIPTEPLFEKARAIQARLQGDMSHHQADMRRIKDATIMYG